MRELTINCAGITTPQMLHEAFQKALSFPDWYGKNLDALHDLLGVIAEDTQITLTDFDQLDGWSLRFRCVLDDAEIKNPNLFINYR